MEVLKSNLSKFYLSLIAVLGWFAIILQYVLYINSGVASQSELTIRFFSFFTIDSNILVTICSTVLLIFPNTAAGNFFAKQTTLAALAIYILVVALIYNTTLRFIWELAGWGIVANELLHVVIPMLYLILWMFQALKNRLQYKDLWSWLIYPLVYTTFVFLRGYYSNFYPYPFMNVDELGVRQVIFNCGIVTLVFVVLSFIFIAIGRRSRNLKKLHN